MRINQPVTDREYVLSDEHFLISHTNLGGRITYANPAFIEVSGFSQEELVGSAHNIVRHPDMPPEAFADLWATLQAGEHWVGLVKNRRKDGGFYWVRAQVIPLLENGKAAGYVSVRTRAGSDAIAQAEAAYAEIRSGNPRGLTVIRGQVHRRGPLGWIRRQVLQASGKGFWAMPAVASLLLALPVTGAVGALPALLTGVPLLLGIAAYQRHYWLRPLREAVGFSAQIAAGNLAAEPPAPGGADSRRLIMALDIMRKSLGSIAGDVRDGLQVVTPAARDMAQANEELAARARQQAAALEQTAASMEQITATVHQNTDNARQASSLAGEAAETVSANGQLMGEMVSTMGRITESSGKITQIVEMIDSIAFQTSILALNAAVEAARAGEQGRGFAVVASEVRNLASRSADAAREIHALISQSATEIDGGAALVRRAGDAMEEVVTKVTRLSDLVGEITTANVEQTTGIEQINTAVADMDSAVGDTADKMQTMARDTGRLQAQIAQFALSVAVFRFRGEGRAGVAPPVKVASAPMPVAERSTQPQHKATGTGP